MVSDIDVYSSPQKLSDDEVGKLRRDAGQWLKRLREEQSLSQRDLAEKVGLSTIPSFPRSNLGEAVSLQIVIALGQRRFLSRRGNS